MTEPHSPATPEPPDRVPADNPPAVPPVESAGGDVPRTTPVDADDTDSVAPESVDPVSGDLESSDDVADDGTDADGEDEESDEDSEDEAKKKRSFFRELPVLVIIALVLAFLIKTFLVQAFYIPSESMENTLLIGDRVLVNKLAYRLGDVQRGDIIVFDGANSFDANKPKPPPSGNSFTRAVRTVASSFGLAPGTDSDYIKRVIGIGGDHVVCCNADGNIEINGVALTPENYLFPGDKPSNTPFDIVVPEDHVWVMGDHRSRSEDSRAHGGSPGGGSVPDSDIVGRAFVVVWPISRFDSLTRPADFDAIPDTPVAESKQ